MRGSTGEVMGMIGEILTREIIGEKDIMIETTNQVDIIEEKEVIEFKIQNWNEAHIMEAEDLDGKMTEETMSDIEIKADLVLQKDLDMITLRNCFMMKMIIRASD
jgi:hypothetical protein